MQSILWIFQNPKVVVIKKLSSTSKWQHVYLKTSSSLLHEFKGLCLLQAVQCLFESTPGVTVWLSV